jgi:hypothetical protein
MSRFNNGTPGTGQGRGFGPGRGADCRANPTGGLGNGQGKRSGRRSIGPGQGQGFLRDPEFFRRNCLGIAEQGDLAIAPRRSRFESLIDNLQRQIDELKHQFTK